MKGAGRRKRPGGYGKTETLRVEQAKEKRGGSWGHWRRAEGAEGALRVTGRLEDGWSVPKLSHKLPRIYTCDLHGDCTVCHGAFASVPQFADLFITIP